MRGRHVLALPLAAAAAGAMDEDDPNYIKLAHRVARASPMTTCSLSSGSECAGRAWNSAKARRLWTSSGRLSKGSRVSA
jgi:hypothetical protein